MTFCANIVAIVCLCYFAREVIGPHRDEQARFPEGLRHAARQLPRSILVKTLVRGALLEYFKLNEYDGTKLNFQFGRRVVASLATDALFSPVPTPPRLAYLDLEAAQRRRDKSIPLFRSRRLNSPVAWAQHKRQRSLRPAKDIEDPYIAAGLIALAQEQYYQDQSRPDHYKVRLLAAKDDNLYFYTALIPSHFLDRFDRPSQRYPTNPPIPITYVHIPMRPEGELLRLMELVLSKLNFAAKNHE
ncbi:hypothetical protein QC761_0084460 [Podospora bellae-mahoneyi]|uniref:Uncharacterized protein n=1 Tax=Podospora bellae-mahoneyi TaxID=2093777 RepID=A0ABR0FEM8_9PEZI|nr:hypothetical protein QC761_0084460 [Podospora bellae-mahoneyi]